MARVAARLAAIRQAFEDGRLRISIVQLQPLKLITPKIKESPKYLQIAASIRDVGLVEPPVVARDHDDPERYLLLDGHMRIEVLKELGETAVTCLISTDDEAFTYNKRVNRIAMIQEHQMIVKAVQRGVPEERIARALNVDVQSIVRKRRLLDGICPEVAEILKDRHVSIATFVELRRLVPLRQIEAAELMVAMNKFTIYYAKSLVAATPRDQLVAADQPKQVKGLSDEQIALMERESVSLQREFRIAEKSYGADHLDLVLSNGYVRKLLGNAKVVRYLAQRHHDILTEFQKLAENETVAA
jgi:ParB-like chromosome segregation protein Spo0J